ncbi:MAG TPA: ATP-binding protein, partial [Blastocatellia bacterium]|nr:ATP-binding protein [Blastocatellia bacterium]
REREQMLALEQHLREQAETANRLKDEFLSVVSHELRTPLHSMLGWARLLSGGGLGADQSRQAIETIARNAATQKQIIDDLLDVSRIITGKMRLNAREVVLPEVIRAAIETMRHAAEAKNIQLQIDEPAPAKPAPDGDPPAAIRVTGDFDRLQQVFWNLLSNAIKFTPAGGRVKVMTAHVNAQIEILISDTGKGIRPEFLPYVFDRFRQQDSTTKRQDGGLGLGLAIARQLVELHGGTVRAESAGEGKGATFVVTLPLYESAAVSLPLPALRADNSGPRPIENRLERRIMGSRILVVDDEPDACDLIRVILECGGAEVRMAHSAAIGYQSLDEWKPDVMVVDIGMPHEDGYDFIRRVRKRGIEQGGLIPAVALTAYSRTEDRVQSLAAGFQLHVAKPVEPEELLAIVATLIGREI